MNTKLLYQNKLNFCHVSVYKDSVYVIMDEGITVKPEYNEILIELVDRFIGKDPFVYITHRKNSYAVDPLIYIETAQIENLAGFIVINEKSKPKELLEFERLFFKKPFRLCVSLDEGIAEKDALLTDFRL